MGFRAKQKYFKVAIGFILVFSLVSLGIFGEGHAKLNSKKNLVGLFKARSKPLSPNTKIFLVAGSSQNANFAQEIIDQRRLWKSIGFRDDEIACYYIIPKQGEYKRDNDQYVWLSLWLPACYAASAKLIREHLHQIAKKRPPFLYFYMTSHGKKPVTLELEKTDPSRKKYQRLKRLAQYPVLDQYRLMIEALADGPAFENEIFDAYKKGTNPRNLYFTPAYLRETLLKFPTNTPKIIVLQGCYSGGFIEDHQVNFKEKLLTSVPQLTLITAARYDRTSFGCSAGPITTYFGGAFNQVLSNYLGNPPQMDWRSIYKEVKGKVSLLETDLEKYQPSLPAFFSNYKIKVTGKRKTPRNLGNPSSLPKIKAD